MNKYIVLGVLGTLFATSAFAGYDVAKKNFYLDVDTMTVDEVVSTDCVQVYRVENTLNGAGTSEKIRLTHLINPVADLTAASTLTSADCGKTLLLNATTEFATTLPAPTSGCKLTFVVKSAPASASYTIVTASSANIFIGHVETADVASAGGDGDSSTADDTITIADGVAVVGDSLEIISDGTSWYYLGHTKVYNGITAAQAS